MITIKNNEFLQHLIFAIFLFKSIYETFVTNDYYTRNKCNVLKKTSYKIMTCSLFFDPIKRTNRLSHKLCEVWCLRLNRNSMQRSVVYKWLDCEHFSIHACEQFTMQENKHSFEFDRIKDFYLNITYNIQ